MIILRINSLCISYDIPYLEGGYCNIIIIININALVKPYRDICVSMLVLASTCKLKWMLNLANSVYRRVCVYAWAYVRDMTPNYLHQSYILFSAGRIGHHIQEIVICFGDNQVVQYTTLVVCEYSQRTLVVRVGIMPEVCQ